MFEHSNMHGLMGSDICMFECSKCQTLMSRTVHRKSTYDIPQIDRDQRITTDVAEALLDCTLLNVVVDASREDAVFEFEFAVEADAEERSNIPLRLVNPSWRASCDNSCPVVVAV